MVGPGSIPPHVKELVEAQSRSNPRRLVKAIDYLVVSSESDDERTPAGHDGHVELAHGVRIERIEHDLAERLFRCHKPARRGLVSETAVSRRARYVREVWTEDDLAAADTVGRWDVDRRLWPAVQLSRLIRDNNTSTEHAAQRQLRADGSEIIVPFGGFESHVVYRLYPDRPGWLDVDEAIELSALLDAYWSGPELPPRVRRALRQLTPSQASATSKTRFRLSSRLSSL